MESNVCRLSIQRKLILHFLLCGDPLFREYLQFEEIPDKKWMSPPIMSWSDRNVPEKAKMKK